MPLSRIALSASQDGFEALLFHYLEHAPVNLVLNLLAHFQLFALLQQQLLVNQSGNELVTMFS